MPAGDYTNCNKCGKPIFGYGLCIECSKSYYNLGMSYDFYGVPNDTYGFPEISLNDGVTTLATILNKQLKRDAKKHVQILAKMMGEPPVSELEFEEFWNKCGADIFNMKNMKNKTETLNDVYQEVIESTNSPEKSAFSKEENLDNYYYEMIDNFEKGNEECDYDIDADDTDIEADELDEIINELEQEDTRFKKTTTTKSNETLENIFDNFFNEAPVQKKEIKPIKRKTLVVNLFAGPGAGKSTTAAGIFFELKSRGINCELATEFVKDLVWEERHKTINNQVYIFAKQHHRITRLLGEVDVIVTDSPLLNTLIYSKDGDEALKRLAAVEHSKLWTFNCLIKRVKGYNPKGRNHTYGEARSLDITIANMLDDENIPYEVYFGNADGKDKIVNKILQLIGEK